MTHFKITALLAAIALTLSGCNDKPIPANEAGFTKDSYSPSNASVGPMVFPAGSQTVYKELDKFKDPLGPQPYKAPGQWVVYMAAPGWTNGGKRIVDRLATDAVAVSKVWEFVRVNRLRDKVKVAWLQYDDNPSAQYMDSLDKVPDNFIPLFLKPHGPQVDYYIHSPATRYGSATGRTRYDMWLKPYLPFAKKEGADYVAATDFQKVQGFNDLNGKYWDSWARHWFIVNPDGVVVDAYFSNLGNYFIQGADKPINSLIHHLDLDPTTLTIEKIVTAKYESYYSAPYWNKLDAEFRDQIGLDK
ncbi:hypothetical protein ACI77O_12050 [Pseudomonas tritici]|uniref:hypothetical protein n=1 Tax=Pseudomonas tritici TaxID=2745518 RepID=UPI00387B9B8B